MLHFSPPHLSLFKISAVFPWDYVDGLWAMKSEGVGLIVRAINYQDFQPTVRDPDAGDPPTLQTNGRTDRSVRSVVSKSRDPKLFGRLIIFEVFQPVRKSHRRTDETIVIS